MSQIGITSVPIQEWETPLDCREALCRGSIFPQLHMPFYIEDEMPKCNAKPLNEREAALLEIQQVTFCLIDLQLFLDTHPDDKDAKAMKQKVQAQRKDLLSAFAKNYYPLTSDCQGDQAEEVAPWGGGGSHVAL